MLPALCYRRLGLPLKEPKEAGEHAESLQTSLAVTAASIALAWLMGYQIPRSLALVFLVPFQPCHHAFPLPQNPCSDER